MMNIPRVLIVENNRALGSMAQSLIHNELGFECDLVTTRAEAEALIAEEPARYTAALVTLNLPDAPDGEVVAPVQAAGIPVVVLTGFYGDELRQRMIDLGVVDYVLKSNISAYGYACRLVGRIHRNRTTKVLAADDSATALAVLRHQLEIQRFEVLTAATGEEALERLAENPDIQLLFTDYNMPGMDGFELVQRVRNEFGKDRLAIIGLSGSDHARLSAHFLKSGANDVLTKPYGYEELLCRVNQNLEILEQIEAIRDAANRDYLTKLYNRRYFFEEGVARYRQAKEQGTPLCAAMMDIDFFKKVNDRHGHDGGDAALRHMAELLTGAFPEELVARFGGEEFCVLMAADPHHAQKRFDAFRLEVESTPVDRDGYLFPFTVSIGLTNALGDDVDAMLNVADANLYRAKEGGRNRVVGGSSAEEANPQGTTRQRD